MIENEIKKINTSMAFTSAMLVAVAITIYVQYGQKDMLLKGSNSKFTNKQIYNLSLLASAIFLIVIIYFEILAIEQFDNEKTQAAENFLTAATLALIAQSLRFTTILESSPSEQINVEDILP